MWNLPNDTTGLPDHFVHGHWNSVAIVSSDLDHGNHLVLHHWQLSPMPLFPVARATLKRCLCEECIEKGGYDEKDAPKGVLMAKRSIVSHILRVKMDRAADNTSSVAVIANDLRRLTLAMDIPVNISSSSTVCTVELKPDAVPVSKKGCNRRTMKALVVLDNIKSRIQQCFHLLLHSCRIDHKAIGSQIDILATQFSSYGPSDDTPIEINTDTLPQDPVNELDEIIQIVLFLGVTCRVIIGVSRSSCDLIMKIISIILFLAFRRPDNGLNSSHTNILKQIPMTSESAEARFHLKGKTVLTLTGELLFAVQRHIPLDHHIIDPFSMYPDFPAKLYSTDFKTRLENAKVSWVAGERAMIGRYI
ncbi:uncharacterized protein F5147DRAFT_646930 [Suillus discolor]|uniref:Uncharacterized protein n=1 Tax=Suillus discolor TaxID=1912936 RepID=A0A9P7FKD2_9AGAM|nr:uncharacterized protein F5147DRAFT_646930 [Suillus discolor]KAG2120415.1 hypothetical protein F5147DRAFT_646930 [Suillus discolor]